MLVAHLKTNSSLTSTTKCTVTVWTGGIYKRL